MFKKKNLKPIIIVIAILSALLFLQKLRVFNPVSIKPGKGNLCFVKRVVDGDTLLLADNDRVRYIGINTPETKHPHKAVEWMGKEASDFNRKLVEHKWISLEFDIEKRDKYGRLLAYVYVDGIFVNAELVKEGFAQVYTFPPNVKHVDLLLECQRQAQKERKGLWSKD
ncbi:MAG: thermonuclease family protein [Candidatus Omnitrophica bacterium]|nr:thermonuclease family protein [Candidatus Omnitrophota bacterium]